MKATQFPFLISDDVFKSELHISRKNNNIDPINISVIRYKNRVKSKDIFITDDKEIILDEEMSKSLYDTNFSLTILSSDDVDFSAHIINRKNNKLVKIQPVYSNNICDVVDIDVSEEEGFTRGATKVTYRRLPHKYSFVTYAGADSCGYLRQNHRLILDMVAAYIYYKFPDRQDRKLCLGDCTPITGSAPGHPGGSHSGCKAFDANYYTYQTNFTQYKESKDSVTTKIWEEVGGRWELKIDIFDWERNYLFFKIMHSFIPDMKFMVDRDIVKYMIEMIKIDYSREAATDFSRYVQGDKHPTYNHDIHSHCMLGFGYKDIDVNGYDLFYAPQEAIKPEWVKADNIEEILRKTKNLIDVEPEPVVEPDPKSTPVIPEPVVEPDPEPIPVIPEPTPEPPPVIPEPVVEPTPTPVIPEPTPAPKKKKKKENFFEKILNFFKNLF